MRLTTAAVVIVGFALLVHGCVLTDDFSDGASSDGHAVMTPRELIQDQVSGAVWAGMFFISSGGEASDVGLMSAAWFESDGDVRLSFGHTYLGSWQVNSELEIVVTVEEVQQRKGLLSPDLGAGDTLSFLPELQGEGEERRLVRIDHSVELPTPADGTITTTIEMRRASDSQISLDDLNGAWRTESLQAGGRAVRYGLRLRATQQSASYGVFTDPTTFIEFINGAAMVFPCSDSTCWGVYEATDLTKSPSEAAASFGGRLVEQQGELRLFIPIFEGNTVTAAQATLD